MRPPADAPGMIVRLLPGAAARPVCVALAGAAGFVLVLVVMLPPDSPPRRPGRPAAEMDRPRPATATPSASPTGPVSRDDARDEAALAYYRAKGGAVAAHVRQVIWTAPILRVYTDLPGSDANAPDALALCRVAAAYLESRDRAPVVFVHARENDGYPVIANKMDSGDGCRLASVP
ncbi:hypothetical protein GCM10023196_047510 [Actinoallomurus vinaceus]|uniref:Uncharacterized protein n=1 Tax=Actinoallomurus vinaceus TaxID=1080074 RepID=A0ABP8UFW4_9ACTN